MSYQTARIWLGASAALAIGLSTSSAVSAEGEKPRSNPFAVEADVVRTEVVVNPNEIRYRIPASLQVTAAAGSPGKPGTASVSDSIRKSAEAVRDAKDDEAKKAAQDVLEEGLSKYFDEDMTQRESELAKIEERLTKLRELLERRRTKKQEIIDLQAKVALNEADGLGFYNTEHASKSAYGGGMGFSGVAGPGGVPGGTTTWSTETNLFPAPSSLTKKPAKPPTPAAPSTPAAPPTAPSEPRTPF